MKTRNLLRIHHFSEDRRYRYVLWREWDIDSLTGCSDDLAHPDKFLMVIGLNPSTADEDHDDPTLRKCIGFAKRWGFGALCMTNLFAFRATQPKDMKMEADPIGPDNDASLLRCAAEAGMILAAWGKDGKHLKRDAEVINLLMAHDLKVLKLNQDLSPMHPLYVPYETKPFSMDGTVKTPAEPLPDGCGYIGHDFGASYPDSQCFGGRLYDMDDSDEPGMVNEPGEFIYCPECQHEAWLEDQRENVEEQGWCAHEKGESRDSCPFPRAATRYPADGQRPMRNGGSKAGTTGKTNPRPLDIPSGTPQHHDQFSNFQVAPICHRRFFVLVNDHNS